MLKFKIIPDIDKNPKIVSLAQTLWGKTIIWLLFSFFFGLLQFHHNKYFHLSQGYIWDKIFIFLLFVFLPQYKKVLLVLVSIYWLFFHTFSNWPLPLLKNLSDVSLNQNLFLQSFLLSIAMVLVLTWILRKINYGVAILLALLCLGLIFIDPYFNHLYFPAIIGGSFIILGQFIWYWVYALKDPQFRYWHLLTFMPFWTWTILPLPKAWQYLNQSDADNSMKLAISQLKALKLIAWSIFLALIHLYVQKFVYPEIFMDIIIANYKTLSFTDKWLAVFWNFIHGMFYLAIGTHTIVSVIRLCGWNVKRNMYRPFEAKSISDFFNRYYYYFKELLVEIFFYPAYFNFFKKSPALRLFFATLMAAGIGNFLFHFSLDVFTIFNKGYLTALKNYGVYAFYCLILSLGIFISQWSRMHGRFQQNIWIVRARILLFFMLLNTMIENGGSATLKQHFIFIFSLFNFLA